MKDNIRWLLQSGRLRCVRGTPRQHHLGGMPRSRVGATNPVEECTGHGSKPQPRLYFLEAIPGMASPCPVYSLVHSLDTADRRDDYRLFSSNDDSKPNRSNLHLRLGLTRHN